MEAECNWTLSAENNGNSSQTGYFVDNSSEGLRYFAGAATIVIIVLGVLGNLLTIAALIKCPKIRNLTVAFITSLAVADLCFCVLVMPWSVYRFLYGRMYFSKESVLCVLLPLVQYINVGVSLLSIAMITINRFIMIAYQGMYGRIYTRKSVAGMVAFIWLFSFAILVPTLIKKWGKFGYDICLGGCSIIGSSAPKKTLFLLGFLTPCITIVACYTGIFWVVRRSKSKVQGHGGSSRGNNKGRTGNDWRLTKMILAIFLSFLVCYLPTSIVKIADKHSDYPDAHLVAYVLIYLSACINPIIYVTMNRQYRQAYKSVLCFWRTDKQTFNTNNSASDKSHNAVNRTLVSVASPCNNPAGVPLSGKRQSQPIDIPLTQMT